MEKHPFKSLMKPA